MKAVVVFFVLWICVLVSSSPVPTVTIDKVVDNPLTIENSASEDLLDTAESSNPRPCGRYGCGGGGGGGGGHRQRRRHYHISYGGGGCGGGGCGGGGCGGGGCGGCRYGK